MTTGALAYRLAVFSLLTDAFEEINRARPSKEKLETAALLGLAATGLVAQGVKAEQELKADRAWAVYTSDLTVLRRETEAARLPAWAATGAKDRAGAALDRALAQVRAGEGRGMPARSLQPSRLRTRWSAGTPPFGRIAPRRD